jgi:hypothetical protein
MYKTMNGRTPDYLTKMFDSITSINSHNLRYSNYNTFVPRPNTEAGKSSYSYRGAVLWNSLPIDIRNKPSLHLCKNSL